MDIKIIGTGCDKCRKLYENTLEAVKITGVDATITKVEDLLSIVKLGVMATPALMIDGKIACTGRVKKTEEIIRWIK
ncbi:MAG: TM0996/MTH895 family glutaredoxin-like protein [Clostridia bacterium]|nr:TM0996/MTH895 family glutaredoxin-like protein [Clostridia bacterium]